jgi:dihydrofolate reductase
MIAAVSSNGVIGIENKLPFDYPADMKHFRAKTLNTTIIMGRNTFEGIGRALPKRRNIVITSRKLDVEGIECFESISKFMEHNELDSTHVPQDMWFVGGARIYEEGMNWATSIHLTVTPDIIDHPQSIKFPWINPLKFKELVQQNLVEGDDTLKYVIYKRQ